MKPITPLLTVDTVIEFENNKLLLIKRGHEPFKGQWALPGGFVDVGETVEDAARRETLEETSLTVELIELLGVYSDPNRDPRGHSVSVVYRARPISGEPKAGDDAAEVLLTDDPLSLDLAFDHADIVRNALKRRG